MLLVLLDQIVWERGVEEPVDVEVLLNEGIVAFIVLSSARDSQP